jgi:F-type H+-transporting ATPase subunit epsilon
MAGPEHQTITVEVCATDRAFGRLEAAEVAVPSVDGTFVVLPGHAPIVAILDNGVVRVRLANGEKQDFAVHGGIVQVHKNRVVVLAKTAEMGSGIDVARAEAARDRATQRLAHRDERINVARAEAALKRALLRLRVQGGGQAGTPPSH